MSLSEKIKRALNEVPIELQRLYQNMYPAFVTAKNPIKNVEEVPVFMFHAVQSNDFKDQLNYLKENNYQTLRLDEFYGFLSGSFRPKAPSVLLTFDDGHKSWYQTAYPLLKEYGFSAVGFIVPSYITESADSSEWMSWGQVREIDRSGIMQFASHTAYHDRIFVGPILDDFFHPNMTFDPLGLDRPWTGEGPRYTNQIRWGTPILQCDTRYGNRLRFIADARLEDQCIDWVGKNGGRRFFREPNWRRLLKRAYLDGNKHYPLGRYETKSEQDRAILLSLQSSKATIQEKIGKEVKHLCYPWGKGSALAVELSRQSGYASNFWVAVPGRSTNKKGDNPFYIPRIKDDYIFRLPGKY